MEKQKRYAPVDDLVCKTMAVEVFREMGSEMVAHLEVLSGVAAQRDIDFGCPPVQWLQHACSAFSFGIARCVARRIENNAVAESTF